MTPRTSRTASSRRRWSMCWPAISALRRRPACSYATTTSHLRPRRRWSRSSWLRAGRRDCLAGRESAAMPVVGYYDTAEARWHVYIRGAPDVVNSLTHLYTGLTYLIRVDEAFRWRVTAAASPASSRDPSDGIIRSWVRHLLERLRTRQRGRYERSHLFTLAQGQIMIPTVWLSSSTLLTAVQRRPRRSAAGDCRH